MRCIKAGLLLLCVSMIWDASTFAASAITTAASDGGGLPAVGAEGDCLLTSSSAWVAGGCPGAGTGAPTDAAYITATPNATLSAETALSALPTGCLSSTTTTGAVASRTITGTANKVTVTNGDCSGNPTLTIPDAVTLVNPMVSTSLLLPNGTTVPGTCSIGMIYFDNDATAGVNLYGCTASNTWTLLGDGGGGSGDVTAASTFGTDNVLIRSDGTSKGVQSTGISVSDTTNDMSGAGSYAAGTTPATAGLFRAPNNTNGPCWRNAANSANLCIKLNASNEYEFDAPINLTGTAGPGTVTEIAAPGAPGTANTHYWYIDSTTGRLATHENGGSVKDYLTAGDTQGVTNKTIDCTTAGNVCTVYKYLQLDLVGVAGGTAGHIWDDDPLSTTCTAASTAGTNQTRAFCTFPDSDGEYGKQLKLSLPTGYVAGSLQYRVSWKTTGTGNLRPRLQTLCYASDAASDTAYSNSTYITAAAGTSGRFNQTAWTTATDTGCDAEETMAIRFSRNRTEASDTLNATADVEFVGVRYAVAQ